MVSWLDLLQPLLTPAAAAAAPAAARSEIWLEKDREIGMHLHHPGNSSFEIECLSVDLLEGT